jgi:hypothetical protein
MRLRARIFFRGAFYLVVLVSLNATPTTGRIYAINLVDVDGNRFSTAGGRITLLVLTTSADTARAREVGDRVPDHCLANPNYRMITVVNPNGRYSGLGRTVATWVIRQRLNSEAKRLQQRYDTRKIQRDARRDVFAVADFDGTIAAQLGATSQAPEFCVFVFGRDGRLLRQWNDVPTAAELDAMLR